MFVNRNTDGDYYHVAFNVKLYNLDFTIENLTKQFEKSYKLVKKLRNVFIPDYLYDVALENAMNMFNRNLNPDLFNVNGNVIDAEFNLVGRSNGWLVITDFEGYSLMNNQPTFDKNTQSLFDQFIPKIYEIVKNRKFIIEFLAAEALFIPTYQNHWEYKK